MGDVADVAEAAPEDVIVALWDGEQAHQLTFEWCEEWRCAAGQLWSGALGSTSAVVEDKNMIASWQKEGRPALERAMLHYNPTGAAAAAAAASSQLSLTCLHIESLYGPTWSQNVFSAQRGLAISH